MLTSELLLRELDHFLCRRQRLAIVAIVEFRAEGPIGLDPVVLQSVLCRRPRARRAHKHKASRQRAQFEDMRHAQDASMFSQKKRYTGSLHPQQASRRLVGTLFIAPAGAARSNRPMT